MIDENVELGCTNKVEILDGDIVGTVG